MNIHQAARKIVAMPELPTIRRAGICFVLSKVAQTCDAYCEVAPFLRDTVGGKSYLPKPGVWTQQRLNAIALLAVSNPKDFL